eukprot:9347709-Ditylum_brightwellii.AAC.1
MVHHHRMTTSIGGSSLPGGSSLGSIVSATFDGGGVVVGHDDMTATMMTTTKMEETRDLPQLKTTWDIFIITKKFHPWEKILLLKIHVKLCKMLDVKNMHKGWKEDPEEPLEKVAVRKRQQRG